MTHALHFRPLTLLGTAYLALIPAFAFADDADEPEEVVVIADLKPTPLDQVGSSVTLLDEEEIVKSQKVSVYDLLRQVPGISVSRNGGLGTVSTVRIRGAEAGQTLVLIDGVKVNDLSAPGGAFNFANLTTAGIERIEVLRGPQSTLYGSDAIGGVINIITKKGDGPLKASGFLEGGSFATVRGGMNLGLSQGKFAGNLSLSGVRTSGISAAEADNGNVERDGFRTLSVLGNFSYDLLDNLKINGLFRYADSRAEFDAFDFSTFSFIDGDGVTKTEDLQGAVGITWEALDGKVENLARISWSKIDRFDSEFSAPSFSSTSHNRTIDVQSNIKAMENLTVIVGGQFQDNEIFVEVFGFFASTLPGKANINSVFSEVAVSPAKNLHLTFGVRHDDHTRFGGHTTFRVTANFQIPGTKSILRANWGQGFKAPTLFQLFSPFGSLTLQSEESVGWEVGIEQPFFDGDANLTVTYFRRIGKNQIDFDLSTFKFANILRTRTKGVEIILTARPFENLTLNANFTHMKAVNQDTGSILIRRPQNLFNATVTYDASERLQFAAGVNFTGRQLDGGVFLSPYKVVDFRVNYDLRENIALYARIENAFDEDYQEVLGFGTPGVAAYAGVRGSF